MGTSNLNTISCRIKIRELLLIKKEQLENSNEASVAEDDYSDRELQVVSNGDSNLARNGFFIQVARFICILIETGFQHMKQRLKVLC